LRTNSSQNGLGLIWRQFKVLFQVGLRFSLRLVWGFICCWLKNYLGLIFNFFGVGLGFIENLIDGYLVL